MKIRTIALDDEPLALKLVSIYIKKTPFLELVGEFNSSLDALEFIKNNDVDLIFSDIHMPDLSGIDFMKALKDPMPKFIFTTAFGKNVLTDFEGNKNIGHLLKPFSYQEFLAVAKKFTGQE